MNSATGSIELVATLPGAYYCDPGVLEKEWEKIFYRSWLYVGREDRLPSPGDYLTFQVGRENILVARGKDDHLRAFYNVCRHRGTRLCADEAGAGRATFQCSYHAWTYGLDGSLLGAPNLKETEGFSKAEFSLYPVALETWRGCIFVNLDGDKTPLAAQLGGIPERTRSYPLGELKVARRVVDEVEANWKILVENYHECYHCPGVHPELCYLVPLYGTGEVDAAGGDVRATFRKGAFTLTKSGGSRRPPFAGLSEQDKAVFNGEAILPNMWINFLPDFIQIRTLWPLGPTRTRILTEWLFEADTMARDDFDPKDAVDFTMLISKQDWAVCEAAQQGIGSRAHRHGVFVPLEGDLVEVDRWILRRLET